MPAIDDMAGAIERFSERPLRGLDRPLWVSYACGHEGPEGGLRGLRSRVVSWDCPACAERARLANGGNSGMEV